MAMGMNEHAQSMLDSAERSRDSEGEQDVAPVLLVWGDPSGGFRYAGPALPGDPELEYLTDVLLKDSYWWYVGVKTLEEAKRELS